MLFGSPINIESLNQENERSAGMVDAADQSESECTGFKHFEEQMIVEKISETPECMNASGALEEENNEVQGSLLSTTSAKNMTPECMKASGALEEENNEVQGSLLFTTSAISMTPLQKDEFSHHESNTTYVAITEEMVRDTEMNTRLESIDVKELESEEAMADRDLMARDTSKKMVLEINKSNPESFEPSDAFNEENKEDHLKLLFTTPIKGTSTSNIDEGSTCQLRTAMIAKFALSTEGIDSKARNKHQGSPMGTKEAKESCESSKERKALDLIESSLLNEEDYREWSLPFASSDVGAKELDHCSRSGDGIFNASNSSKDGKKNDINYDGKAPVSDEVKFGNNYAGSEDDIFKDLDGDKFLNSEDRQILSEMTDDTSEATLQWFQNEGGEFPRQAELESREGTVELTASTNECQHFFNEVDVPAKMDSDPGKSCAASQQADCSFDNKENVATESVISSRFKSHVNNSFIEEGIDGEDTLMSRKKTGLAEKKGPLTPAGVAKTSFATHLNSTVKKNNARTILIHGTPSKISQNADMKENAPCVKGERIGALTTLRPEKRGALKILPWK